MPDVYSMGNVVTLALRRLRVLNYRKQPDAETMADGVDALNSMMHAWKSNGVDIGHFTLAQADDFPLGDEHVQGVAALLAIRLASNYGKEIDAGVARDAEMGWAALEAEFVEAAPDATIDTALTRVSSRNWIIQ